MIDIAREFIPVQDIYDVLNVMSFSKLNALHIHISDDDSLNLELPSFPGIVDKAALKKG